MSWEKTVLSPGKIHLQLPDRWAGAGREDQAWMAGRAWMAGQGQAGPGGGGTCVFLNTEGKIRYFLLDFFREVQDISLV